MESRWSDREAAEYVERFAPRWGEELALRVYTSRLIGRDPDLVMHGGGNTSLKGTVTTLVGDAVEALFVKGSGWDLDAIEPPGLPAVDLAHLRKLRHLGELSDPEMVNQLRTHLFDAGAPTPSVETLLHAFLPHKFIDHTHADIALVPEPAARRADAMVREAFGPRWAIVPYVMPGFALAKLAAEIYERDGAVEGLVLLNHGLFSFADDARTAYERMIAGVDRAERFVRARTRAERPRVAVPAAAPLDANAIAARIAPVLRGALAEPPRSGPAVAADGARMARERRRWRSRRTGRGADRRREPAHARSRDPHEGSGDAPRRRFAAPRRGALRERVVAAIALPRGVRRVLRGQQGPRTHEDHEARRLPARRPRARRRHLHRRTHEAGRPHRGRHRRAHAAREGARERDRPLHGPLRRGPFRHGVLEPRAGEAREGEGGAARGTGRARDRCRRRDRLRGLPEARRGRRPRRRDRRRARAG
jgi:rhamnose utilization protein RhaD (predicted bifunctional aldolase and dehydrogenase)